MCRQGGKKGEGKGKGKGIFKKGVKGRKRPDVSMMSKKKKRMPVSHLPPIKRKKGGRSSTPKKG